MKFYSLLILSLFMIQNSSGLCIPDKSPGEDDRKKITHEIIENLSKEKYDQVQKKFHTSLKANLPVEMISETWRNIVSINGQFEKVLTTTTNVIQEFNQVRLRCKFEKENLTLEVTFNEDDKVIGLYFKP